MKMPFLLVLTTLLLSSLPTLGQPLAELGTDSYDIFAPSTSASYTQTATTLTLNGGFALGDQVSGTFSLDSGAPYDWSGISSFGILLSSSGVNPNTFFSVRFYDDTLALIARYEATTDAAGATPTEIPLSLAESGAGNLGAVRGFEYTWDGSGTGAGPITVSGIVPEPSTWALLAVALVIFGSMAWRRRSVVARR